MEYAAQHKFTTGCQCIAYMNKHMAYLASR